MQAFSELISKMRQHGVGFEKGLTASEIDAIEDAVRAPLPPDLADFYRQAFPVADPTGASFPEWRNDPKGTAKETQRFIEDLFEFDIEHNSYWHEDLGPKPEKVKAAQGQAVEYIRNLPPLICLFAQSTPVELANRHDLKARYGSEG